MRDALRFDGGLQDGASSRSRPYFNPYKSPEAVDLTDAADAKSQIRGLAGQRGRPDKSHSIFEGPEQIHPPVLIGAISGVHIESLVIWILMPALRVSLSRC